MDYKIKKLRKRHIPQVAAIEQECFPDPWSEESLESERRYKYALCFVAVQGKVVVGYCSIRRVVNEGHINNIAVSPAHQNKGIASMLLERVIYYAKKKRLIGLTLEVRVSNKPAISLYKKYGFVSEGVRKNYYSIPPEDALVMWKYFSLV